MPRGHKKGLKATKKIHLCQNTHKKGKIEPPYSNSSGLSLWLWLQSNLTTKEEQFTNKLWKKSLGCFFQHVALIAFMFKNTWSPHSPPSTSTWQKTFAVVDILHHSLAEALAQVGGTYCKCVQVLGPFCLNKICFHENCHQIKTGRKYSNMINISIGQVKCFYITVPSKVGCNFI